MSNQSDRFFRENGAIVQRLEESLDAILDRFNEGVIPGNPEKSNALSMLDAYLDVLIKFNENETPAFICTLNNDTKPFIEQNSIDELIASKDGIGLLIKLAREKMIKTDHPAFSGSEGKKLLDSGYCNEITLESSGLCFYILSKKGKEALKSKKLLSAIREKVSTAVLPQSIINESPDWSGLYIRRVEMINRFFEEKRGGADHIIFSLDKTKELVFGCEINDSELTDYYFAGIFDENASKDEHISKIKQLADSSQIDHLIILVDSESDKRSAKEAGLKDNPSILYELLK